MLSVGEGTAALLSLAFRRCESLDTATATTTNIQCFKIHKAPAVGRRTGIFWGLENQTAAAQSQGPLVKFVGDAGSQVGCLARPLLHHGNRGAASHRSMCEIWAYSMGSEGASK
jgi:hypothetical protein